MEATRDSQKHNLSYPGCRRLAAAAAAPANRTGKKHPGKAILAGTYANDSCGRRVLRRRDVLAVGGADIVIVLLHTPFVL